MLRSSTNLVLADNKGVLAPDEIKMSRLTDANAADPSNKASIQSVRFNDSQLLLTAGYDKTMRLFSIDGKNNPKVASAHFREVL